MGINTRRNTLLARLGGGVLVFSMVVSGVTMNARVAWADPHGVFYTAIGQQQLFFNVLAALDQADYVETAFDREKRRQAREEVEAEQPFEKETESGGRFTEKTQLEEDSTYTCTSLDVNNNVPGCNQVGNVINKIGQPAILARDVTLEGADMYTDQLVREFGAESARRNAAAELLQTLCEYGFGIEGCDNETTGKPPDELYDMWQRRAAAVVIDPLTWQSLPWWSGAMPALFSGSGLAWIPNLHPLNLNPIEPPPPGRPVVAPYLTDEEFRAGKIRYPEYFGWGPLAYSAQIDFWRKQIQGLPDAGEQQAFFDMLVETVIDSYQPGRKIVAWPYAELVKNQSGGYDYRHIEDNPQGGCWPATDNPPCISAAYGQAMGYGNTADYINDVDQKTVAAFDLLFEIPRQAADRVAMQQGLVEDEGLKADTRLASRPAQITNYPPSPFPALSKYGEIYWYVANPVAAREAAVYGIPNVLGQLATSQQASALTGLDKPGGVQLVKRAGSPTPSPGSSPNPSPSPSPSPVSAVPAKGNQVAGALDLLFKPNDNFFDKEKEPTSPSANIISPILEYGARHALRVMTAGTWRPGTTAGITCGYTCD